MTKALTREVILCAVWPSAFPGSQSNAPGFKSSLDVFEAYVILLFTLLCKKCVREEIH